MQSVVFRDGLLRMRLPKAWLAEYLPDGGAQFKDPSGVGVLLLNVIDFEAPAPVGVAHAVDLLSNHSGHEGREVLQLTNDNVLVAYSEEADGITAFMWEVVHPIPPDVLRMAVFTFPVTSSASQERNVIDLVSMITREIAHSTFE